MTSLPQRDPTEIRARISGISLQNGGLDRKLRVRPAAMSDASLNATEAFLLSRIEDGATLEEVLDLSPMPQGETLEVIESLLKRGLIETAA